MGRVPILKTKEKTTSGVSGATISRVPLLNKTFIPKNNGRSVRDDLPIFEQPNKTQFFQRAEKAKLKYEPLKKTTFFDVVKEIPYAVKEVGRTMLQAPPRTMASFGIQSASDVLSIIKNKNIEAKWQPKTKLERMLLGKEEIKGIFVSEQKAEKYIKNKLVKWGFDKNTSAGMSLALAPVFITGMVGIDLMPVGRGDKVVAKNLVKKNLVKVAKDLTRQDLISITRGTMKNKAKLEAYKTISSDPALRKILSDVAHNKKIPLTERLQTKMKDFFEPLLKPKSRVKIIPQKQLAEVKPTVKAVPDELTPLAKEARKYKSAEEFVRGQENVIGEKLYLANKEAKKIRDEVKKLKEQLFETEPKYAREPFSGEWFKDVDDFDNFMSNNFRFLDDGSVEDIYLDEIYTAKEWTEVWEKPIEKSIKEVSEMHEKIAYGSDYRQLADDIYELKNEIIKKTGAEPVAIHKFTDDNYNVYPMYKIGNFEFHNKIDLGEWIEQTGKKIDIDDLPSLENISSEIKIDKIFKKEDLEFLKNVEIKTKSQLTDIYNKAVKETKPKPDPLITEARKYKSAEEFIDKVYGYRTEYGDYNPKIRKYASGTRLDELGFNGEKEIYVYRGVPDGKQSKLNQGDFVSGDKQTADIFGEKVIKERVKLKDLIIDESGIEISTIKELNDPTPLGSHFIYLKKEIGKPLTKSQLTDIYNKAKKVKDIHPEDQKKMIEFIDNIRLKKPREKIFKYKTGKEQLAERESIKRVIEEEKMRKEALRFYDEEMEYQYQNFKKLKVEQAEDVEQLKMKNKNVPAESIDNIFYSQDKSMDELFDMFRDRYELEKIPLPKLPKETKAVIGERVRQKIKSTKEILDRRRAKIKAIRDHFGLTDNELRKISRKDIRLMDNFEFEKFIDDMRIKAEKLGEKKQAMNELLQQIKDKELNIENLRKAMKLPTMKNMTIDNIKKLDKALLSYQKGDEFLSVRKLETVDRTELKGIKTWREVRERLSKKLGVPIEKLQNIKVSEFDRFKYDTGLAEKDPFYRMMVEEPAKRMLISGSEYLKIEKEVFALAKKLKPEGIIGRLIPQQKNIRKFMETPIEKRGKIEMTEAEIDLADYMTKHYLEVQDYLIQMEAMKMGKQNYFTHIRRGILEATKEDSIIKAVKEVFTQYKLDEQGFNILDKSTGEILAMDKFFKFAMHRTGKLKPTENVVKAFLTYMRTFKKKQALDEIVPLIDIYAHSLTPKGLTKKGLFLDGNLIKFTKEWLNTQKGRHITLIAKQNGKIDGGLRAIKMFTSLRDLGLNIPVSVATEIGEQISTYQLLGKKKYALGKIRQNTKQGKKIIEEYRNLIGKNPWKELVEPSKEIGDRLMEGIFILFRDSAERANRTFLLGSLSKQEFQAGKISADRLAALRTELGRYRMVDGMKSIIGATPEGKSYTQYKKWAIPHLRTTIKNLGNIGKKIAGMKVGSNEWKKSALEIYRLVEITAFVMLMFGMVRDEDDKSFIGKIMNKAYREATTLIQALNPAMFLSVGRTAGFIEDLGENLYLMLTLEKYKTTDEYKSIQKFKRQFTPVVISQFKGVKKEPSKTVPTKPTRRKRRKRRKRR